MINISVSAILSGLLFGVIGLYVFRSGKKEGHLPHLALGIALMIYPYFTSTPLADWGLGVVLCFAAYYFK